MQNRKPISDELKGIYPVLADNIPLNPYTVDPAYFKYFPELMLGLIRGVEPGSELTVSKQNPYSVPEHYFERFPWTLLEIVKGQSEDVQDELKTLSPVLSSIGKRMPFDVPTGYFDQSVSFAGGNATNTEQDPVSTVLQGVKKEPVFTVPYAYFENLPTKLLDRIKNRQPGRVVRMSNRAKILRYAVAAAIVGVITIVGIMFLNNKDKSALEPVAGIEEVSEEELENFLDGQMPSFEEGIMVSSGDIDGEDLKEILSDIPEAALQQYLNQYTDAGAAGNN